MDRQEAIQVLQEKIDNSALFKDEREAYNMAIEALSAEPNKAVPPSLADVYKWERDIALSQLEEYGIGFAEKKRDDLLEVVRCKDCLHHESDGGALMVCSITDTVKDDDDFCSYGERKSSVSKEEIEYLNKAFPEHDGGEWFDITDILTKGERR